MEENRITQTAYMYNKINNLLPLKGKVYCWGLNLNRDEFVIFITGIFTSSNIKEVNFSGFGWQDSCIEYINNKLIYSNGKEKVKEIEVEEYYFDGTTFSKVKKS